MYRCKKPLQLVADGLPEHKSKVVRDYVAATKCRLTQHFLPDYAADLNPDEPVRSHAKRTGVARQSLQKGEILVVRIYNKLQVIAEHQSWCVRFSNNHLLPIFLTTG